MACCAFATSSSKQLVGGAGRAICRLPPRPRTVVVLSSYSSAPQTRGELVSEDVFFSKKFQRKQKRPIHHVLDSPLERFGDRIVLAMAFGLYPSFSCRVKVPRLHSSDLARSVAALPGTRRWQFSSVVAKFSVAAALQPREIKASERRILRNMTYTELEEWMRDIGFKKSQALMLWKCLYGSGKWAATVEEMSGLSRVSKDFLQDAAELNVLKDWKVYPAADGTRKVELES